MRQALTLCTLKLHASNEETLIGSMKILQNMLKNRSASIYLTCMISNCESNLYDYGRPVKIIGDIVKVNHIQI